LEIEQSNYLIYQFKKYLSILQEIKEAANKRFKKLIKAALKKESYYNYELPLVELWEVVAWKFKKIVKNNVLYINFLKDLKITIENIFKSYSSNTRSIYKKIWSINGKFLIVQFLETENLYLEHEDEIEWDIEFMIKLINSVAK